MTDQTSHGPAAGIAAATATEAAASYVGAGTGPIPTGCTVKHAPTASRRKASQLRHYILNPEQSAKLEYAFLGLQFFECMRRLLNITQSLARQAPTLQSLDCIDSMLEAINELSEAGALALKEQRESVTVNRAHEGAIDTSFSVGKAL